MLSEFTILLAVAVVGTAVHEFTHAAACQYYGARWRPSIHWRYAIPNPAIRTELRDHTPLSFLVTCLSPLIMFVPIVAVVAIAGPRTVLFDWGFTGNCLLMWCFCSLPSPTDCRNAWYATDLETLHAVWYGEHPSHTAAEGIN